MRIVLSMLTTACAIFLAAAPLAGLAQPVQPPSTQPSPAFAALIDAARAHPGVLGLDTGVTTSGRQIIFAWFEDKAALVSWYKSDVQQRAMQAAFPNRSFEREPLPDLPADSGPILAIVSLTPSSAPPPPGARMSIGTIGIELYTPLPGGVAVGGRFAPPGVRVPGLREIELGVATRQVDSGAPAVPR